MRTGCLNVESRLRMGISLTFLRAEADLYSLPEVQKLQTDPHLAMERTPVFVHSCEWVSSLQGIDTSRRLLGKRQHRENKRVALWVGRIDVG